MTSRHLMFAAYLGFMTACIPADQQATTTATPVALATASNEIAARPANVRVIDADTIALSGQKIRLNGISAAERGHPSYAPGQAYVRNVVAQSGGVVCALNGQQSYDRLVGTCFLVSSDGQRADLQASVVSAGLARDCPRYSGGRYRSFETSQSRTLPLPGYC